MHSSNTLQNRYPRHSATANPLLKGLQAFWRFSVFYGKFITTPIEQRARRYPTL